MTAKNFLELVEIRTKIASFFPFLFGSLYAYWAYGTVDWLNGTYMLVSLLLFDMTTTAVNNYMDYRKAEDREYRHRDNVIGSARLSLTAVRIIIGTMFLTALAFGIVLALRTGPAVLLLGAAAFAVGLLYTAGPVPISRLPLGEIFSGLFMGFLIPLITVLVHCPSLIDLGLTGYQVSLSFSLRDIIRLFSAFLPFVFIISNIMLANNICDLEQDVRNRRYTLPHFIGIPSALALFRLSYYGAFLVVLLNVIFKILPAVSLLTLLCFFPVRRNTLLFAQNPSKKATFVQSVRNMVLVSFSCILPLAAAVLWDLLE